jgi:hypothetical protein
MFRQVYIYVCFSSYPLIHQSISKMGKDYQFKVIIAGGGVVGLTLANALEVLKYSIH